MVEEKSPASFDNLNKELEALNPEVAAMEAAKKGAKKAAVGVRKPAKKKVKVVLSKGKRKTAVARARLTTGNGLITVNNVDVNLMKPKEVRELILEPVRLSDKTAEIIRDSDVKIVVYGGGASGQAQAARTALAKVLADEKTSSYSESIKRTFMDYDRSLLVDDVRLVEPKKFLGPKARARFQKSYR